MLNKHSAPGIVSPVFETGSACASEPMLKIQAPDITNDLDLTVNELVHLLDLASAVKRHSQWHAHALAGRYLTLLFEKPSLRTRMTFELAIKQLGGDAVVNSGLIGEREPLKDVARNLDRWTQGIVARTYSHRTIVELAHWSKAPVINALSDLYHPCQALADAQTLKEHFGSLAGLTIAFVGDGNNVAHSLMLTAVRLGAHVAVGTPAGYGPKPEIVQQAAALGEISGGSVRVGNSAAEAVSGANAVYTDVWTSMGQEAEAAARREIFQPFQVNAALMGQAAPNAVFMHCLPAKREEEVTDDVVESPASVVFDQAENRLHAQKALLLMLLR
jgi:ornithine carbamoyltransferase